MISISVNTATLRKNVVEDVTTTPGKVFGDLGVDTSRAMVTLNGGVITTLQLNNTFAELGAHDGDEIRLTAVVKADGAAE